MAGRGDKGRKNFILRSLNRARIIKIYFDELNINY